MTQELWQYFTLEQLEQYLQLLVDPDAAAAHLATVLSLPDYRFDARNAIKLDFASYALEFCSNQQFGPQRTASVFNIAQHLLLACQAGTPFAEAEAMVKAHLLQVLSPKAGSDSSRLSPDHIAKVGLFLADTFFRHYRLYSYVFSHEQNHTVCTANLLVETPTTQPLEKAMLDVDWRAHHTAQAAAAAAATAAAEEAAAATAAGIKAAQEEAERVEAQARIDAELKRKPATLEEAIEHMVAIRLEEAKAVLQRDLLKAQQEAAAAAATAEPSADGPASVVVAAAAASSANPTAAQADKA